MFDLEKAVCDWADAIRRDAPALEGHIDEIVDHLMTSIEARIEHGDTAEAAFLASVSDFGDTAALTTTGPKWARRLAVSHIVAALVWATVIVWFGQTGHDIARHLIIAYAVTTFVPLVVLTDRLAGQAPPCRSLARSRAS